MASARRGPDVPLAPVLDQNIRALIRRRRDAERRKGPQERAADAVTRFTGSMAFVYLHLALFAAWILWNVVPGLGLPRFDPSLVILAMVASVEAIFLSTFILISQNRMQALADRRADLDLQVNLLAEHEVTRLIRLVKRIGQKLEVEDPDTRELAELERDVHPDRVLDHLEHVERTEAAAAAEDGR